jgi:hypothetical protein
VIEYVISDRPITGATGVTSSLPRKFRSQALSMSRHDWELRLERQRQLLAMAGTNDVIRRRATLEIERIEDLLGLTSEKALRALVSSSHPDRPTGDATEFSRQKARLDKLRGR